MKQRVILLLGLLVLLESSCQHSSLLKRRQNGMERRKHSRLKRRLRKDKTKTQEKKKEDEGKGYMGGYSKDDGAKDDLESEVKSFNSFFKAGNELMRERKETETEIQYAAHKVVQLGSMVNSGMKALKGGLTMISNIGGLAKSSGVGAVLASLGPVAVTISLGLGVLTLGEKWLKGEPLIDKSDSEKQLEAIQNVANKVDNLSQRIEFLFQKQKDFSEFLAAKTQYQNAEEKMIYAVEQHQTLKTACLQRDNEYLMSLKEEDHGKDKMTDKQVLRLKYIDRLRQKCDAAELIFKQKLEQISFDFEYRQFIKIFSGETGRLGTDFWKSLLKSTNNDFAEYEDIFTSMTNLVLQASLAFINYNLATNKHSIREQFIQTQQVKMFGLRFNEKAEEQFSKEYFAENYDFLVQSTECDNCLNLDASIQIQIEKALSNYDEVVEGNNSYLKNIQEKDQRIKSVKNEYFQTLQPILEEAISPSESYLNAESILAQILGKLGSVTKFKQYSFQLVLLDKNNKDKAQFSRSIGLFDYTWKPYLTFIHDFINQEQYDSQTVKPDIPYKMVFQYSNKETIAYLKLIYKNVQFKTPTIKERATGMMKLWMDGSFFKYDYLLRKGFIYQECNDLMYFFSAYTYDTYSGQRHQLLYDNSFDITCQRMDEHFSHSNIKKWGSQAFDVNDSEMKQTHLYGDDGYEEYIWGKPYEYHSDREQKTREDKEYKTKKKNFMESSTTDNIMYLRNNEYQGQGNDNFYQLEITMPIIKNKNASAKVPTPKDQANHKFILTFSRNILPKYYARDNLIMVDGKPYKDTP